LVPALIIARIGQWTDVRGRSHPSLFDDAMVSMSYARTLASGHGLVWYRGAPHVEGITNLLWTILLAIPQWAGLHGDSAVLATKVLGLACVWFAALVAASFARSFHPPGSPLAVFLATIAVAANVPLLFWSVQGMEVGFLTFLTLAACVLTWRIANVDEPTRRDFVLLGSVIAAGIATRTDFLVVAVALLMWAAIAARPQFTRVLIPILTSAVLACAVTTVFRLAYYGAPLPNTYYLKVTGVPLATRLLRGAVTDSITGFAYVVPAALLVAICWRRLTAAQRQIVALLLSAATMQFVYAGFVGGDAWEWYALPNRYLTPALVCVVLAAALCIGAVTEPNVWRLGQPARALLIAAACAAVGPLVGVSLIERLNGYNSIGFYWPEGARSPALIGLAICAVLIAVGVVARSSRKGFRFELLVVVIVLVALAPEAFAHNQRDGGASVFAQEGDVVKTVTLARATIAVRGAGASEYVSNRAAIDMLGKSDRHIAHELPATSFFNPGHNKYDMGYSVGTLKPDVVVDPPDVNSLPQLGYERMRMRAGSRIPIWARMGSPLVRWDLLLATHGP
jgi:hypothetical protein